MSEIEKIDARELLQLVIDEGVLDLNVTTTCSQCKAIFPLEYVSCPQCGIKKIYHLKYK